MTETLKDMKKKGFENSIFGWMDLCKMSDIQTYVTEE